MFIKDERPKGRMCMVWMMMRAGELGKVVLFK